MATDTLVLGPVLFTGFSVPPRMPLGGEQAMKVHKLPGGQRVIDTLGPDDADVSWAGFFFQDDAWDQCLILEAMRIAGDEIPLMWGGLFYNVVVKTFKANAVRFPVYCEYSISCTISFNPMAGPLAALSSIDSMVSSDIASAMGA